MQELQPVVRLQLTFEIAAGVAPEVLDDWLLLAGASAEPPPTEQATPEGAWLWRILLLARALLQAARLPVFATPRIESALPDPAREGRWIGTFRFPIVDLVEPRCHEIALGAAARLCRWAAPRGIDEAAIREFHGAIDHLVLAPLQKHTPGGKGTVPVLRAAHALQVPFMHLGGGTYQLGWGSAARRISRSVTSGDSAIGARMSESKWDTARLLAMAGLPAPDNALVTGWRQAQIACGRLGWPVVVKPADRERGEGVTVDIEDDAALKQAFETARGLAKRGQVIVERQVPGVCHRLVVSHGRLLYAVKRLPMSVRADGRRTVGELVDDAVAADSRLPPWQRSGIRPLDAAALQCIRNAGWTPDAVAPQGSLVPLRRIESTAWGGVDEDVSGAVHPENISVAIRAAALLGLEVAGIDIITTDISRPWQETGAIINEVNFSPLLGGGDISRSHLPEFIRRVLGDSAGRIPVRAFVGDTQAEAAGRACWEALRAQGLRCAFVAAGDVLGADGQPMRLAAASVRARVRALLLDATVDALVFVMTPAEFQAGGLPVPGIAPVFPAPATTAA